MICSHLPFLDRLKKVAEAGFSHYEFWPWRNKDIDAIIKLNKELNLVPAQFSASPKTFKQGITDPRRKDEFLEDIKLALGVAARLDVKKICVVAGEETAGYTLDEQNQAVIDAFKAAAPLVEAAVAAALRERQVLLVVAAINTLRRKALDRLGKELREVGNRHARRNLGLRKASRVNHGLFILDLLPFEAPLVAVRVEALAILPGDVEEAPRDLRTDVGILDLERRRLDRERAAVFGNQGFVDPPRTVANHVLGMLAQEGEAGAHAVRGVVHRGQTFPIAGPAFHVLLV